jgi:hypothetical protein
MVLRHFVHARFYGVEVSTRSLGMTGADLESVSGRKFADFAGAVGFDGGEVRAWDARVIDYADFHGVGGETNKLAILP